MSAKIKQLVPEEVDEFDELVFEPTDGIPTCQHGHKLLLGDPCPQCEDDLEEVSL